MDGQRDATRRAAWLTACGPLLLLVFSGCEKGAPVDPSRAKVESGIHQLDRNEFDAAIASFTEALQTVGDTVDAHNADPFYYRGMAYVSQGLIDKAIDDFTRALSIDARYVRAYCGRGRAFLQKGFIDVAIEDFSQAIVMNPRYVEPRWRRAEAHLETGSYARAIRDALRAIQLSPREPAPFAILGSAYLASREYQMATLYLDEAIRIDPTLAKRLDAQRRDAYWDLAQQFAAEGKLADADTLDKQAAAIWSDWVPPPRRPTPPAGVTEGSLAGTTANKPVVAAKPVSSDRVASTALELVQAGKLDQAIAKLTQAIASDPQSAPLHYVRGLANLKKRFPDTAIEDFNRVIYWGPASNIGREAARGEETSDSPPRLESPWQGILADAYYQRGKANLQLENPLSAARDCTRSILRRPDDARAYYLRGLVYLKLERFDRVGADMSELKRLHADLAEKLHIKAKNQREATRDRTGRKRDRGESSVSNDRAA
ncbi:MAG: tetratricopeptide repeat protein [Pirellulales bacterium]